MNKHTRPAKGGILVAFSLATGLAACKTTEEKEQAAAGNYFEEWSNVEGAVDPNSLPEPPTTAMMGTEFLEDNQSKDGVVILPSGLQYRILDQGNGSVPGLDDSVLVHYKMINVDGAVVDNSRDYDGGKPQSFRVAKVIGGWREALLRMPEGSRWKLYVPPDLGYGSTGVAGVRANETLIYELELFKVISSGQPAVPDLGGIGDASLDPLD